MNDWKKAIKQTFDDFKNKDGVIGYWQADAFILELLSHMKTIYKDIYKNDIDLALNKLTWLIEFMSKQYVDDSSTGCMGYYYDEINEICEEFYTLNEETKNKLSVALKNSKISKTSLYYIDEKYFK